VSKVVIFGAGVAGLTAAQELSERGYTVDLYEKLPAMGGKARSFGKTGTGQGGRADLPGEHGFRFYPGFYKHVPDTMSRIPLKGGGGYVVDNLVKVPTFSLSFSDAPPVAMYTNIAQLDTPEKWGSAIIDLFSHAKILEPDDAIFFSERMLLAFASCDERRAQQYENMSWEDYIQVKKRGPAYKRVFSDGLSRPLVALDPAKANARTAITIMLQLLQDLIIPGRSADRILNGPTSDTWIDHWLAYLTSMPNFECHPVATATGIAMKDGRVEYVTVDTNDGIRNVTGDYYLFAVPVEVMQSLLTPQMLAVAPELSGIREICTSWMTGLVYYFSDTVAPKSEGHMIYTDSPWALTSISELLFWPDVNGSNIGSGNIRSVFSTIISNWDKPGIETPKTAAQCTNDELVKEVIVQLNDHRKNIPGGQLDPRLLLDAFLDPAISFDGGNVVRGNSEPLLINTVDSYRLRPPPATSIPNLFLAGDYVRTMTNLATMEGACEAARRAVIGLLQQDGWSAGARPEIFPLQEPALFGPFKWLDKELLFPNGLDPRPVST
jgi:15-cis-phytoene desaturase